MTMLQNQWESSNPALGGADDVFQQYYGSMAEGRPATVTLQGVVNRTAILVLLAIIAGGAGYWMVGLSTSVPLVTLSALASMAVCFGVYFALRGNPARAKYLAPVYAIVEGIFLGTLSGALDAALQRMDIAIAGGVAAQAFVITVSIMLVMLVLYSSRILKPSRRFVSAVQVATGGIMLTYLISWPLALIFGIDLPFIGLGSAVGGGWTAWIGVGLNVLILGVASMWLIIDFQTIEAKVQAGALRELEWYCGFILLVSLAWIYYEALKLVFRLAILFSSRE